MKKLLLSAVVLLVVFSAVSASAADISGKWTAQDKDPEGNPSTITYEFKQEGVELTGTVSIPIETANISNGSVDALGVSFVAVFSFGAFTHTGTIHGDEITLTVKSDDPSFTTHEITLKRSK
jgi:hypothetical protein